MPKALIIIGSLLIVIGLLWHFVGKLPRLPGDIVVERENFKFYAPIGTSIVLSLILTLIMYLFSKTGR